MATLAGRKIADRPESIPMPTRCELCGTTFVEIAGVYLPGRAQQAQIRPRNKPLVAVVYG